MEKPIESKGLSQIDLQNKYTSLGYCEKRGIWEEDYFGEKPYPARKDPKATNRKRYVNLFGGNGRTAAVFIEFSHNDGTSDVVILQLEEEIEGRIYRYTYDNAKD
jgi:hypothetical protein